MKANYYVKIKKSGSAFSFYAGWSLTHMSFICYGSTPEYRALYNNLVRDSLSGLIDNNEEFLIF